MLFAVVTELRSVTPNPMARTKKVDLNRLFARCGLIMIHLRSGLHLRIYRLLYALLIHTPTIIIYQIRYSYSLFLDKCVCIRLRTITRSIIQIFSVLLLLIK